MGNLERPINLTVWAAEAGEPRGNPQMHRDNMQSPYTERFEPKTFLLKGNTATSCTSWQVDV